jgi:hypothetical protein
MKSKQKLVYGVGTNDLTYKENEEAYQKWSNMLKRCYHQTTQQKQLTYIGCSVCDEWKVFSNFKAWFDIHSSPDQELDKDILIRGNKIYGPAYCKFVPKKINILLSSNLKGTFMQGVTFDRKRNKYVAQICVDNKNIRI